MEQAQQCGNLLKEIKSFKQADKSYKIQLHAHCPCQIVDRKTLIFVCGLLNDYTFQDTLLYSIFRAVNLLCRHKILHPMVISLDIPYRRA